MTRLLAWLRVPEPYRWGIYTMRHIPGWRTRAVVLALIIGIVLGAVGTSAVRAGLLTSQARRIADLPVTPASLAPTTAIRPSVERWAEPTIRPVSTPAVVVTEGGTSRRAALHSLAGIASWGCCWAGVVTRLPRGTHICVYGPLGSWCGRSVGYGPAKWTGRIVDLSRSVFAAIVGDPSLGLGKVRLTW